MTIKSASFGFLDRAKNIRNKTLSSLHSRVFLCLLRFSIWFSPSYHSCPSPPLLSLRAFHLFILSFETIYSLFVSFSFIYQKQLLSQHKNMDSKTLRRINTTCSHVTPRAEETEITSIVQEACAAAAKTKVIFKYANDFYFIFCFYLICS